LIDGTAPVATPFLTHLPAWQARTHLKGKYLDEAIGVIKAFAKAVPCDIETLTSAAVQAWIETRLKPTGGSRPVLPSSVAKWLKYLRSYFKWMQGLGMADAERTPFNNRAMHDHRDARERNDAKVKPFEVADVPRLLTQAQDDTELVAIIRVGAYTGMRREEICALSTDQVREHAGIRYLHEVGEKTESAIRNVPIPTAIAGLIEELCANATQDGFLIHDGKMDKHGHRGAKIGARFSTMKTAMGFAPQFQFRSLRKTAIRSMKEQKIVTDPFLLSVIKNIVGHHDADITSGRYAGVSGLADKLRVMETITYPA